MTEAEMAGSTAGAKAEPKLREVLHDVVCECSQAAETLRELAPLLNADNPLDAPLMVGLVLETLADTLAAVAGRADIAWLACGPRRAAPDTGKGTRVGPGSGYAPRIPDDLLAEDRHAFALAFHEEAVKAGGAAFAGDVAMQAMDRVRAYIASREAFVARARNGGAAPGPAVPA